MNNDWFQSTFSEESARMVVRIRRSLEARLEGRNEGGDIEVMKIVDLIEAVAYNKGWEDATPQR